MEMPLYTQAVAGFGAAPSSSQSVAFPGSAGPFVHRPTVMYEQDAQPFGAPPVDDASKDQGMGKVTYGIAYVLGTAGSMAGIYHGYKRNNGSIGWALAWGLIGGIWPISVPLMLAQGYAKPISQIATANRRKARRNGFKVRTGDLVPLGRLSDIDAAESDRIAVRATSGWDYEVRKFASRSSMKEFLKKEARKSDYGAHGKRDWSALEKDAVKKNMVAYPSFQKEA